MSKLVSALQLAAAVTFIQQNRGWADKKSTLFWVKKSRSSQWWLFAVVLYRVWSV
jgi:hypothetical protein